MTELLLIRHGETDFNRQRRWQGQRDLPLNDTGRAQVQALAGGLAGTGVAAIVTSDLRRARQTAQAVAAATGAPVSIDSRLREIALGAWEGLTRDEIAARDGARLDAFRASPSLHRAPGGESAEEVRQRVMAAIRDIVRAHPKDRVAVVSHGLALAAIKVTLLGLPLDSVWNHEPDNAALETLSATPEAVGRSEGGQR
jgi:broad specificity phosphatase PhoE